MASGRASYEGKKQTRCFPAKGGGSLLANPSSGWMRHLVFIAADCTAAARKAAISSRRSVDGAHPLLQGRDDPGADRLHGGRDRSAIYFVTCPLWLKKPAQNRAMCPIKEKESESY